jgi:hypothetical protein
VIGALARFLRDLTHLHIGKHGLHRWTKWRERTWCTYCGREA